MLQLVKTHEAQEKKSMSKDSNNQLSLKLKEINLNA